MRPGSRWRILAKDGDKHIELENQGVFDELVIDNWFHLEQMDTNQWWMRIGDGRDENSPHIWVTIEPDGKVRVSSEWFKDEEHQLVALDHTVSFEPGSGVTVEDE